MRGTLPDALVIEFPGAPAWVTEACGACHVLDVTRVLVRPRGWRADRLPLGPRHGRADSMEVSPLVLRDGFSIAERRLFEAGAVLPIAPSLFLEQRMRGGVPRTRADDAAAFAARVLRDGLDAAASRAGATARQREMAACIRRETALRAWRPLRLADVARALGCSPFHLLHTFRRVEGTTIRAHHGQLRLRAAAMTLIASPGADLSALAFGVGFSSHSHFTAAFRRAFGMTPSALAGASRRVAC